MLEAGKASCWVRTPALLLKAGRRALMFSVDLRTRGSGGHVVVELRGELDLADAAGAAAALAAVAGREPRIIADLAALEFIDSSGVAALARGRRQARRAGGDLLLAAPAPRGLGRAAADRPGRPG